jgi:acyl carrier protein
MRHALERDIRKYIVDAFLFGEGGDRFTDDDSLLEQGIIDSTGVLELVAFLSETFGIQVEDHELVADNFDSVNKLSAYVQFKRPRTQSQTRLQAVAVAASDAE